MLVDSPVPGVSSYGQTADAAKLAYQQAVSKIGLNRQNLLRQYGYQADFDPTTGNYQNLRVDGNNLYGGLQQMLRSQSQDSMASQDNAIGRGLHGGLAHQMESAGNYQHGAQDAQFGTQMVNDLSGQADDWRTAGENYNNALYEAQWQAAQQAISNGDFNPADYSGIDTPGYGDTNPYVAGAGSNIPGGGLAGTRATASAKVMAKTNPGGAKALAATSAAMNAKYGLGKSAPAKTVKNAYTNGSKKRG